MIVKIKVNGKLIQDDIKPQTLLIDWLRDHRFYSVKRGCDTSNCGLCTVWLDERPILSCGMLAVRCDGHEITTLEGLQKEAECFGTFMANEGAEQCGYCSPGFIMNVLSMEKELENPSDDEILEYLSGNMCRCSGYMSQLRAIKKYLSRGEEHA